MVKFYIKSRTRLSDNSGRFKCVNCFNVKFHLNDDLIEISSI